MQDVSVQIQPRESAEPTWQEWIDLNIRRGCTVETMIAAMTQAGAYDLRGALTALRTHQHPGLQAFFDQKGKQILAAVAKEASRADAYVYEPPHLFTGPTLRLQDREIRVLTRIERPFVAVLENVLTAEECETLINLSRSKLQVSHAVDPQTGVERPDPDRTSRGTYFFLRETPFIANLDERLTAIMGKPIENGEGIQVLNYTQGGEYKPHHDYFPPHQPGSWPHITPERGGQRVSTLIMYLNDVERGGETIFPQLGLSIAPRRGLGLYFEYTNSRNQVDPRTLHGGAPVLQGEKWIATKWMHQGRRC